MPVSLSTDPKLNSPKEGSDYKKYYFDEVLVEAFLRQLLHDRFVLVTAEPGEGVSTFLNYIAHTIQDKVRPGAAEDSSLKWLTIKVRPGVDPQGSLIRELSKCDFTNAKKSVNFEAESDQLLNSSNSLGLINLFNTYPVRDNERLLIIIDPLDDLFLFETNYQGENINRFINLLYTFPQHSSLPVYFAIAFSNKYSDRSNYYIKLLDLLYKYKFKYTGPILQNLPEMMRLYFQYLSVPINSSMLVSVSEKLRIDLEPFQTENFWKYLLQMIQEILKEEWLLLPVEKKKVVEFDWLEFYDEIIGEVDTLVDRQAELIMKNFSEDEKDLCLLMFRTQLNKLGNFEPIKFQEMKEILSGVKSKEIHLLERLDFLIQTFTVDIALLELIYPIDISDRGTSLAKDFKISPGTIIMLRNNFFKTQWSFFNTCVEGKVKLVLDYEWYCRIAQKEENGYPVSLQSYALAGENNAATFDNDEFSFLNVIQDLTPAWVARNIGDSKSDREDLDCTKRFIKNGIAFWKKKAEDEEKERKRRAKKRERLILSVSLIIILLGSTYFTVNKSRDRMQDDFDILMQENTYIRSTIDSLFIAYLKDPYTENTPEIFNSFIEIKRPLTYKPKEMQIEDKFLYRFLLDYNTIKSNQNDTVNSLQSKGYKALCNAIKEYDRDTSDVLDSLTLDSFILYIDNKMQSVDSIDYEKFLEKFPDASINKKALELRKKRTVTVENKKPDRQKEEALELLKKKALDEEKKKELDKEIKILDQEIKAIDQKIKSIDKEEL